MASTLVQIRWKLKGCCVDLEKVLKLGLVDHVCVYAKSRKRFNLDLVVTQLPITFVVTSCFLFRFAVALWRIILDYFERSTFFACLLPCFLVPLDGHMVFHCFNSLLYAHWEVGDSFAFLLLPHSLCVRDVCEIPFITQLSKLDTARRRKQ